MLCLRLIYLWHLLKTCLLGKKNVFLIYFWNYENQSPHQAQVLMTLKMQSAPFMWKELMPIWFIYFLQTSSPNLERRDSICAASIVSYCSWWTLNVLLLSEKWIGRQREETRAEKSKWDKYTKEKVISESNRDRREKERRRESDREKGRGGEKARAAEEDKERSRKRGEERILSSRASCRQHGIL